MILAALLLGHTASANLQTVVITRDQGYTAIECVVPLGEMTPYARRMAFIAAANLRQGSAGFTRGQTVESTLGPGVEAQVVGDTLRIGLLSEAADWRRATLILADALRRPKFTEESLERALPGAERAMESEPETAREAEPPTVRRVTDWWMRYVNPTRAVVAIVSPAKSAEFDPVWRDEIGAFRVADLYPEPVSRERRSVTTDWRIFTSGRATPMTAARWLAAHAIGSGKGAMLFRSLRRDAGLTYRQEAYFIPRTGGFQFVIAFRTTQSEEAVESAMMALPAAIDAVTDSDRLRAVGIANRSLRGRNPWDPLAYTLLEDGADPRSIEAWRAAIWPAVTGQRFSPEALSGAMANIETLEMQDAMRDLISGLKPVPRS